MSDLVPDAADYGGIHSDILLESARRATARNVNALMTATYWEIGRRIVEFEQGGKDRAEYGDALSSDWLAILRCALGAVLVDKISSKCGRFIGDGLQTQFARQCLAILLTTPRLLLGSRTKAEVHVCNR